MHKSSGSSTRFVTAFQHSVMFLFESLRAAFQLFAGAVVRDAVQRRRAELAVFGGLSLRQGLPFLGVAGDIASVFGLERLLQGRDFGIDGLPLLAMRRCLLLALAAREEASQA